jgi:hypothetical protein
LKERFQNMTRERGMGKKKSIVAAARRLAVLMYTLSRTKTDYEARPWRGGERPCAKLSAEALRA